MSSRLSGTKPPPRANSMMTDDSWSTARAAIRRAYHLADSDLLGSGMEAEVYRLDAERVLKLHRPGVGRADLATLQQFYAALDTRAVAYAFPRIYQVEVKDDVLFSIEARLPGKPLQPQLPQLDDATLTSVLDRYLEAALALSRVRLTQPLGRYKLFDADGLSHASRGDWHAFWWAYVQQKLPEVEQFFTRDVPQLAAKLALMEDALARPYTGTSGVIHGDFFPGNLLVDHRYQVQSIVDFGLMTMIGDPLFDIATGWVFLDMYDQLRRGLRQRFFEIVVASLGAAVIGRLYRYVLLYCLVSANAYARDCSDGHYRWCVAQLNDAVLWDGFE